MKTMDESCPIVPDAVPVGTPIVHEAAGPVKWCWCARCNRKVRESDLDRGGKISK